MTRVKKPRQIGGPNLANTVLAVTALMLAHQSAAACTTPPIINPPSRPSQSEVDATARSIFSDASYIAEVTVITPVGQHPGLIRVDRLIKGTAPEYIEVPLPDPCFAYYQRAGERAVIAVNRGYDPGGYMADTIIASMRRQGLGNWSH